MENAGHMPRRRRSMFASGPSYGRSAMWLEPGTMRRRRRRGPARFIAPLLAVLVLAAAVGAVGYVVFGMKHGDPRRDVAQQWATAWSKGDHRAMWALVDAETQKSYPLRRFA